MHNDKPAKYGVSVTLKEIPSLRLSTPAYAYGWVIPNKELYESVREDLHLDCQPYHLDEPVGDLIWARWKGEAKRYMYVIASRRSDTGSYSVITVPPDRKS